MDDQIDFQTNLGEGAYGKVFKTFDHMYVAKLIKRDSRAKHKGAEDISPVEIDILCRLQSPYLLKCSNFLQVDKTKYVFGYKVEYCDEKLYRYVNNPALPYTVLKQLMLTACLGLRHLHRAGYFHLDLSRNNILCKMVTDPITGESTPIVKIIDFGLSNAYTKHEYIGANVRTQQTRVTENYRPPEIQALGFGAESYGPKVDVWSLGINLLEIFSPTVFLYKNARNQDYVESFLIDSSRYVVRSERINFLDLFNRMTRVDPKYRYTIEEVIDHPYWDTHPTDPSISFKRSIQDKFGDECKPKNPKPLPPIEGPIESMKNGILKLMEDIKNVFARDEPMELWFIAFDIYMRLAPLHMDENDYTVPFCIMTAYKIYYSTYDFEIIESSFKYDWVTVHEKSIQYYVDLDGIIKHTYFYHKCNNDTEAVLLIYDLISTETASRLRNYTNLDFDEVLTDIRKRYFVQINEIQRRQFRSIEVKNMQKYTRETEKYMLVKDNFFNFVNICDFFTNINMELFIVAVDLLLKYITKPETTDSKLIELACKNILKYTIHKFEGLSFETYHEHTSVTPYIENNNQKVFKGKYTKLLISTADIPLIDQLNKEFDSILEERMKIADYDDADRLYEFYKRYMKCALTGKYSPLFRIYTNDEVSVYMGRIPASTVVTPAHSFILTHDHYFNTSM